MSVNQASNNPSTAQRQDPNSTYFNNHHNTITDPSIGLDQRTHHPPWQLAPLRQPPAPTRPAMPPASPHRTALTSLAALEALKRDQLVKLAKHFDLKANGKVRLVSCRPGQAVGRRVEADWGLGEVHAGEG